MIRIEGLDLAEVVGRTVDQIRSTVDEAALRKVGFAGAEIFRDEAKHNAQRHIKTGLLYENIIVKRLEEESDGGNKQVYLVTVREGGRGVPGAYYWRWVEYGHRFVPKNTKVSQRTGRKIGWKAHRRAAELEYGTATAPAYPFMRPAYESKKAAASSMMTSTLSEQLRRNMEA